MDVHGFIKTVSTKSHCNWQQMFHGCWFGWGVKSVALELSQSKWSTQGPTAWPHYHSSLINWAAKLLKHWCLQKSCYGSLIYFLWCLRFLSNLTRPFSCCDLIFFFFLFPFRSVFFSMLHLWVRQTFSICHRRIQMVSVELCSVKTQIWC